VCVVVNCFSIDSKFKFLCHDGLECFNNCCKDINIFLTPLDVLALKKELGITSRDFLEKYTIVLSKHGRRFPIPIINMNNEEKKCPFVTSKGCSVYKSRPWSCRMAPVDLIDKNQYRLCFDSSYCYGLKEDVEWTIDEWIKSQGIDLNNPIEKEFGELKDKLRFTGLKSLDENIKRVFFMVCYNIDLFKIYVFESSFLQEFRVDDDTAEKIRGNELELLKFGFKWLANNWDIKKSIKIRDECLKKSCFKFDFAL